MRVLRDHQEREIRRHDREQERDGAEQTCHDRRDAPEYRITQALGNDLAAGQLGRFALMRRHDGCGLCLSP